MYSFLEKNDVYFQLFGRMTRNKVILKINWRRWIIVKGIGCGGFEGILGNKAVGNLYLQAGSYFCCFLIIRMEFTQMIL